MGKKDGPDTPDPYRVSESQTQSNLQTAKANAALNRVNQTSPFGAINWAKSGVDPSTGVPLYTQKTTLTEPFQNLLDTQTQNQQGLAGAITGAIGNIPGKFDASGIDPSNIAKASYESSVARMTPQFEEGWRNLETTLSDRGIPIGSEIWNNEQNRFDRARGDTLAEASRQAELAAGQEAQRQFGNKVTEYQLPLGTLSTLQGMSSPVTNPTFSPYATSTVAPTDVSGNIWNAYTADTNAANQRNANLWGGVLGLGKLGLGAYDYGLFS